MTSHAESKLPTPQPENVTPLGLPEQLPIQVESDSNPANVPVIPESRVSKWTRRAVKAAGGLALATYFLMGGEQQADAEVHAEATKPAATADANTSPSNESGLDLGNAIPIGLSIVTAGAGVWALRKQTKENTASRFAAVTTALGEVNDKTTGEQRGRHLESLGAFSERRDYKVEVFKSSRQYLLGRRSGIEKLKEIHLGSPDPERTGPVDPSAQQALERAITERRYADRDALRLFQETLPAARQAAKLRAHKNMLRPNRGNGNKIVDLAAATDAEPEQSRYQIKVRGINLDNMRGIEGADFSEMDMTGAGLKINDMKLIDFSKSSLREAHLRKSIVAHSDLRGTDLRAAYFHGAVIRDSLIDKDTKMGELPDTHTKARRGGLDYEKMDEKRGNGEVVLRDLKSRKLPDGSRELSDDQIVDLVKSWQRNGIKLQAGSNHEYFLNPEDDPNWSGAPST